MSEEEENPPSLSDAMAETVKNSDLRDVAAQVADAVTDAMADDGVIKDLPVVGAIYGLGKAYVSVQDRLFIKKLAYFMSAIADVPAEERREVIEKIDASKKYRVRVGEKLLYIVNSSDDHEQARAVAHLFSAFLDGKMDYGDFLEASKAVQAISFEELCDFVSSDEKRLGIEDVRVALLSAGLYELDDLDVRVTDEGDWKFRLNGDKYVVDGGNLTASLMPLGQLVRDVLRGPLGVQPKE